MVAGKLPFDVMVDEQAAIGQDYIASFQTLAQFDQRVKIR